MTARGSPCGIYEATGRIMDGNRLLGCAFIDRNNKQYTFVKSDVIGMAAQGLITNIRVVKGPDGRYQLRGKGVNLLTLPVVDVTFKGADNKYVKVLGIIFENEKSIGAVIENGDKEKRPISKNELKKLIECELIINIKDLESRNVDFFKLTDKKIVKIDKTLEKVKATKLGASGILYDLKNNTKRVFSAEDNLVCYSNGELGIVNAQNSNRFCIDILHVFDKENSEFDDKRYRLEPFGHLPMEVTSGLVAKWSTMTLRKQ